MTANPDRLLRFRKARGLSQFRFGKLVGVSGPAIGHLESRKRLPGVGLAFAIEKATQEWDEGPIRAVDWLTPHDSQSSGAERAGESQ